VSLEAQASLAVPAATIEWLLGEDNPAVAVLTRRMLLSETDSDATRALWARRNEYPPVAKILDAIRDDGTWTTPGRDYHKYDGNLWQVHFLGELWADPADERIGRAAEYVFSRQLPSGAFSVNGSPAGAIRCLTANVGRALARLGYGRDERIVRALAWVADKGGDDRLLVCAPGTGIYNLNRYCHMLAPKALLFLAEVPRELWPDDAEELREAAVGALRDKAIFRCLPTRSRELFDLVWSAPAAERASVYEKFMAEVDTVEYGDKPGWLRFGFPLSYNSDALEALAALSAVGETRRPEYEPALALVRKTADPQMRWRLRNTFNGKMLADVEVKNEPSKWLTLRALRVLGHFGVLQS
jgi:hypothetical protein